MTRLIKETLVLLSAETVEPRERQWSATSRDMTEVGEYKEREGTGEVQEVRRQVAGEQSDLHGRHGGNVEPKQRTANHGDCRNKIDVPDHVPHDGLSQ